MLDETQIAQAFARDGFVFPLRVMSEGDADRLRQLAVRFESDPSGYRKYMRGKSHLVFQFVDELCRQPGLLDAVEPILGPDLMIWAAAFFVKPPRSAGFVSWHQDLNYWGLDGTDEVTAWLALSEVTVASGCMQFVPGSHQAGIVEHHDTFADSNLLSRGQELAVDVDEKEAVNVCLSPGEVSLHHGRLFHASSANTSDTWRVGVALRYIKPSMRQVVGRRDFAQLVRGEDRFHHFEAMPPPQGDPDPEAMRRHDDIDAATKAFYFNGTDKP